MQFIRLSTLQQAFPGFRFPITEPQLNAFREQFYNHEVTRATGIHEKEQWLQQLQSDEFVLFMEWTEQERSLVQILDGSGSLQPFANATQLTRHALFNRYQAFVTPFLQPQLSALLAATQLKDWHAGLSYLVLLKEREADLVQQVVYEQLKAERTKLEETIRSARSEETLHKAIRPYLTAQFLETLNLFTSSFYRLKADWMQILKSVANHPSGTRRLVLYVIGELNRLHLNPDHRQELNELEREIKSGTIAVEKGEIPWKRIIALSSVVLLIGTLIWAIWIIPSSPERDKPQERTSFMDFSVEERQTIDSLLQQGKTTQREDDNALDRGDMNYVGEELVVKIPWKNQNAEYLVSNWREKDSISRTPRTEDSKKEDRVFPTTEPLSDKNGTISAKFQNDTELSVLIVVFKDLEDEWVYSEYVEKGGMTGFKLHPGDHLYVLPGSKVPKHLNAGNLPFQQVDSRFFDQLQKDYTVDDLSPSKVKFVWKALNNYDFLLIDVNGALNL